MLAAEKSLIKCGMAWALIKSASDLNEIVIKLLSFHRPILSIRTVNCTYYFVDRNLMPISQGNESEMNSQINQD